MAELKAATSTHAPARGHGAACALSAKGANPISTNVSARRSESVWRIVGNLLSKGWLVSAVDSLQCGGPGRVHELQRDTDFWRRSE